jgi:YbbR domain-containing protein
MNLRELGRVLLAQLGTFGLSVLLATIVWVVAVNQQNPLREGRFPPDSGLPIEVVNIPEHLMLVNDLNQRVVLELRAPVDSWQRLEPTDVRVFVDLAGLEPGLHEVEVHVEIADPNVRLLSARPDHVTVRLDEVAEKVIPVRVDVVDPTSVPLGYAMRSPVSIPPTVTIRGPRVQVERVERAEAAVFLAGAKTMVDEVRQITLRDEKGRAVSGPRIEPAEVEVQVPIEQRTGYREVAVKAVITGTVAPGFWISGITVQPATVTVVGNPDVVSQLSGFVESQAIDVTGAQKTIRRRVNLALPADVSLLGEQAVEVTVQIMPVTGGKTIQETPQLRGVGPGLTARVSPASVDVILSGPLNDLQNLSSDQVQVVVDLSGKGKGTYQLEPVVSVPSSLQVQAVVPAIIEATVEVATATRDVSVPVHTAGLDERMESLLSTERVTVTVAGSVLDLQAPVTSTVAVTVTLTGLGPGSHMVTPTVSVPPTLTVQEVTPPQLEVILGSRDLTQELNVKPSWEGLGSGLLLSFRPARITVTIGGPALSMGQLAASDVRAILDVHSLLPGTYYLTPRIVLPKAYRVVGIEPPRLRVLIWKQS